MENFRIAKVLQTSKPFLQKLFQFITKIVVCLVCLNGLGVCFTFDIMIFSKTIQCCDSIFTKRFLGRTLLMVPAFELFAFNVHKRIGDKDDNLELVSSVSKVYIVDDMIPF